jgi:hypothetical protein
MGELQGRFSLDRRVRGAPTDHGEKILSPEHLSSCDGKHPGVDASRVSENDPSQRRQMTAEYFEVGHASNVMVQSTGGEGKQGE